MPGTLVITTLSDGTNSTSATNCIQGSAKAWVRFAGSTGSINKSYNVSSITRNGTGSYVVNFTNALPDANYTPVAWCSAASAFYPVYVGAFGLYYSGSGQTTPVAPTTSSFIVSAFSSGGTGNYDPSYLMIAVFD